jgi:hypothetical protein
MEEWKGGSKHTLWHVDLFESHHQLESRVHYVAFPLMWR